VISRNRHEFHEFREKDHLTVAPKKFDSHFFLIVLPALILAVKGVG